jgi:predicted RNase H-like HicB family nuclease
MQCEVRLTKSDDCWIVAEVPELPGCISQGRDKLEALANIREAMAGWLRAEEQKKRRGSVLSAPMPSS